MSLSWQMMDYIPTPGLQLPWAVPKRLHLDGRYLNLRLLILPGWYLTTLPYRCATVSYTGVFNSIY